VCERAGYAWMKIADPALLFDTRAVVRIGSPEELARFAAERGATLASGALPKRAEAPPMMVQTPPGLLLRAAGPERAREAA
jgi:hypothetical protein